MTRRFTWRSLYADARAMSVGQGVVGVVMMAECREAGLVAGSQGRCEIRRLAWLVRAS
jgi:hypothetical protein